jgi:hypothetical protein
MNILDDVVEELFVNFQQKFPLASRTSLSKTAINQRIDDFYKDAHHIRKNHRLWLLNWARVVLKFQERLLLLGYPPDGVKPLLLGMIISSYTKK